MGLSQYAIRELIGEKDNITIITHTYKCVNNFQKKKRGN